jgi:hypothetical protein
MFLSVFLVFLYPNMWTRLGSDGYGALTAVKRSPIFWHITPYSPVKFNIRFGGTYRFHLDSNSDVLFMKVKNYKLRTALTNNRKKKFKIET